MKLSRRALLKAMMRSPNTPFWDSFIRSNGTAASGWINQENDWSISGNKGVYTPTTTERVINGGAEGTYTSGLAPNWTEVVSSGTKAEEDTIIHGGLKAEHVSGAGREYLAANTSGVTTGKAYHLNGWIKRISGTVKFVAKGTSSVSVNTGAVSGYEKYGVNLITDASLFPTLKVGIDANTGEGYADDFSALEYSAASRFLLRKIGNGDWIVGATICFASDFDSNYCDCTNRGMGPGLVMMVDNPTNPQNYLSVNYDGLKWYFCKTIAGVTTALVTTGTRPTPAWNRIELRKVGSAYSFYLDGNIVGTAQTVTDVGIINNRYAGIQNAVGFPTTSFVEFWNQPANANKWDYEPLPVRTQITGHYNTSTYPTGKAIVSLRFDDGYSADYSVVYPQLISHSLVAGFAVIAKNVNGDVGAMTLAQLLEMQTAGMEIMCHSMSHTIPPTTTNQWKWETQVAGEYIRRMGLYVDSFVQPGGWYVDYPTNTNQDYYGLALDTMLREFYQCWDGYHWPLNRTLPIPAEQRYCARQRALNNGNLGGTPTSAQILTSDETFVDVAIANGYGIEFDVHSGDFDTSGNISTADFITFLDYLQTKVGSGDIVVLTPTQQLFATPV